MNEVYKQKICNDRRCCNGCVLDMTGWRILKPDELVFKGDEAEERNGWVKSVR